MSLAVKSVSTAEEDAQRFATRAPVTSTPSSRGVVWKTCTRVARQLLGHANHGSVLGLATGILDLLPVPGTDGPSSEPWFGYLNSTGSTRLFASAR